MTAQERRARIEADLPPLPQALAGCFIAMALLFQPGLGGRLYLCAFSFFLCLAVGRRVNLLASLVTSTGIVAASLFIPIGKVLIEFGPLRVTQIAFIEGVERAATFEGLLFISKAAIRPGLSLPGGFGKAFSLAMVYYDRFLESRRRIKPASFVRDIDETLLEAWERETPDPKAPENGNQGVSIYAIIMLGGACALASAAFLVDFVWRIQ